MTDDHETIQPHPDSEFPHIPYRVAAVARASEHGAYRTAASAFLASKGLIGEFDAWCAERGMPADAVGRLVEVARAAHNAWWDAKFTGKVMVAELAAALDALPPGILDQEPSEGR